MPKTSFSSYPCFHSTGLAPLVLDIRHHPLGPWSLLPFRPKTPLGRAFHRPPAVGRSLDDGASGAPSS